MHVLVDQNALTQALSQTSRIINPQNAMPILAGVELRTVPGKLIVYATDLISSLTLEVSADVREPGRLVVSSQTFSEWIRRVPTAMVELLANDGKLQVRYGRNRATLQIFADEYLPELENVEGASLSVPADTFQRLSRELLFSCSRDDTRGVLRGIGLTYGHGRMVFEATDGSRFSQTWIAVPEFLDDPTTIVLPAKTINEAARIATDAPIRLTLGRQRALIEAAGTTLLTRLLDGAYPDLSHAAPEEYVTSCLVSASDFRGGLERMNLLTARDHLNSVRVRHIPEQGLELSSSSQDVGDAIELIACESHGPEMDLLFNPQYLIEALKSLPGEDALFEISGPQSAARLRTPEGSNYFHAVLPMRQLV